MTTVYFLSRGMTVTEIIMNNDLVLNHYKNLRNCLLHSILKVKFQKTLILIAF